MSGITLADITAHEAEGERIQVALDRLAREIAEVRGDPVPPDRDKWGYVENRYIFDQFSIYDGIIDVQYYWSHQGGGEYHRVRFPIEALTGDWRAVEAAKLAEKAAAEDLAAERIARALV